MNWTTRLRLRLKLLKVAALSNRQAQARLESARAKDLHPRQRLVDASVRARHRLRLRRSQVREAQRHVKNTARAPRVDVIAISPNRSSRRGVKPRLIVLHITVSHNRPGLTDVKAIASYFKDPNTRASSHIVNDSEGNSARCVPDEHAAWTQAAYNPRALSIEQIEFSNERTARQWTKENRPQLDNTALWVAHWSKKYGIPLTRSITHGVCQHSELGRAGGGHSDCGPGYPIGYVLAKARELNGIA